MNILDHLKIPSLVILLFFLIGSACTLLPAQTDNLDETLALPTLVDSLPTSIPASMLTETIIDVSPSEVNPVQNTPSSIPQATKTEMPAVLNHLNGLPVIDPESLELPPALIPISNFPVSVRPQSGLSFSPLVFEYTIGEGMTRFLAFYYGDLSGVKENGDLIGPVHSGRLPDEQLRQLYSGFLLISSASANVARNLYHKTDVYARTDAQIGQVMLNSDKIIDVAKKEKESLGKMGTQGMRHEVAVPPEGLSAHSFWLMYSYPNQVLWRYDEQSGAYQRYQDRGDAVTFEIITDRLTGKPLEFENVIIMFVEHEAKYETMINFNLTFFKRFPAFLLRDGRLYKIFWSTTNTQEERATGRSSPIRFVDYDGNPFPLKPGQTWVQFVQPNTPYWESIDSEVYFDRVSKKEPGSGHWSMIFEPPIPLLELP